MFISDRRIYLNADRSRVVEEDNPEATFLLVAKGGSLDDATAEQYGLLNLPRPLLASSASEAAVSEADATNLQDEAKAIDAAENKAVEPAENKQIFPAANPRVKKTVRRER